MSRTTSYAAFIIMQLGIEAALTISQPISAYDKCSEPYNFECRNSKCILKSQMCDGFDDCLDGSDEMNCDVHHCSEKQWFLCKNHKCISKSFVCDMENDCGDLSDEQNCTSLSISATTQLSNCSGNEWQCSDHLCILSEWVCNGEIDCLDGSDESVGCAEQISCNGFKCNDGECINKEWRCDGSSDCKDQSDEKNCDSFLLSGKCKLDEGLVLCNKSCVKLSQLCDGSVFCPYIISTKTSLCSLAKNTCSILKCSHDCIVTPSGSKCTCSPGYSLINGFNCTDINECKLYGVCDQKCRNVQGSYECFCDRGYTLLEDKKTCKVKGSEAVMIFSSKTEIRGYYLQSEIYFPIAKNVMHGVGVAYDGNHIYWTEVFAENESIVKALEDGTHREVVVTSGLGTPEDLAIDWITGNIYFTDVEMQHIGVCTNDGIYCTVIVNQDVNKPRSIVLNPLDGEMYWSDWGKHPEIARSKMDGTEDVSFISNEIYWPNGLALDRPNQRLYWTDAKSTTLESINLDGSDRRVILEGIVKHPYALDIFENRIYWSDWETKTIESCDKFTGKNHHILIKQKERYIYGIHIYHSLLQPRSRNPCEIAFCSHICLLSGTSYSCACPENTLLGTDGRTCRRTEKDQLLIVATSKMLWKIQFQQLGKHNTVILPVAMQNISALAFGSRNNSLFISDVSLPSLVEMDLYTGSINELVFGSSLGHITAMDFDNLGNNLYWCDFGKGVVEVLNLNTMSRKVLLNDMVEETPSSIALVPHEGIMFVAFQTSKVTSHIDRFNMDGSNRMHVVENALMGPLHLVYDFQLDRIFWTDFGTGNIESTSITGDDRHDFRYLQNAAVAIASQNKNIFWINRNSRTIYWADKTNSDSGFNKKFTIDIPNSSEIKHLISVTPRTIQSHSCHQNNGNCSHLCLVGVNSAVCSCPLGMKLQADKKTCIHPTSCDLNEYFCKESSMCIPREMRCDHHTDCSFGEDEGGCETENNCTDAYFQCRNKDCIRKNLVCDMLYDCNDKSDEENCNYKTPCLQNYFKCNNGNCVKNSLLCDGKQNCKDGSDEINCGNLTCNSEQFRCSSGICIPKHWECDQELDCADGSDEHKNCGYATCKSSKFMCKNGLCIDSILKCNKIDDCGDFSDENDCKNATHSTTCKKNEFQCYNNTSFCFPMSVRCNGSSECPHHEDEQGCTDCQVDEFECNNKRCIPTQWLCNHVNDCGDGSDENEYFCSHEQNSMSKSTSHACDEKYRCKSGQCIDISLVCNNEENCNDGSDEYGACAASCLTNSNPCAQICIKTPSGPQCQCTSGYKLRGDGRTCTDIKECLLEPPVCSQLCNEIHGSYKCSCYNGYILRADETSCKSIGEAMSFIFATFHEIYQLSQANNTLKILYYDEMPKITSIDVSVQKGYLYFCTEESGTLHRLQLQNQIREFMNNVGRPQILAVDWITENVYYVNNNFIQKSISICNFERQYCAKILNINIHSNVSALAVDAVNEYLFYSTSRWQIFNYYGSVIYKCNLDGSQLQEILQTTNNYVTGLTYNVYKKNLYYMDHNNGQVYKMQYDGTNQAKVITNLTRPTALTTFDDHLYFYNPDGYMTLCPLFKNYQACKSYKLNGRFNELFVILHSSRQPAARNTCQNENCKSLCVQKNNTPQCICDFNKINADEHDCESKQVTAVHYLAGMKSGESLNKLSLNRKGSNAIVVAVIIAALAIALVFGIYYYFHKKQSGNFNISMRFQNPVYGYLQDNSQEVILHPGQHEYYNPMELCCEKIQTNSNQLNEKLVL